MFIRDQHSSSGSILVFLNTKHNINSILSLYHITMSLNVTVIHITTSIYRGSTTALANDL